MYFMNYRYFVFIEKGFMMNENKNKERVYLKNGRMSSNEKSQEIFFSFAYVLTTCYACFGAHLCMKVEFSKTFTC